MLNTLVLASILFFLLTIYSIVQSNLNWFHLSESRFWSLKILDTASAATLFVTLVGALLVRHQFAIGVLPRINYVSELKTEQSSSEPKGSFETWNVMIRNTGLGSAIIDRVEYFLDLSTSKENNRNYSFNSLVKKLEEIKLVFDSDYSLFNISSGFSLAPKDEYAIFVIKAEHLPRLSDLTMKLYFQGQLGDKYSREISLVRKRISN